MTRTLLPLAIIIALVMPGCAWFQDKETKPALELATEGMAAYQKGRYQTAIENFETLRDWYPFSKYAMLAQLKIADAHYQLEEYDDAVSAYEEFETLHPQNEAIPYVLYQIGRCYFDQLDTVDRDQNPARKAIDAFKRLIAQYPDDSYSVQAQGHIAVCVKSLAAHDLYVGRFYFKARHYPAALKRFEAVIRDYPDVGVQDEALRYIALCRYAIKKDLESKHREKAAESATTDGVIQ